MVPALETVVRPEGVVSGVCDAAGGAWTLSESAAVCPNAAELSSI